MPSTYSSVEKIRRAYPGNEAGSNNAMSFSLQPHGGNNEKPTTRAVSCICEKFDDAMVKGDAAAAAALFTEDACFVDPTAGPIHGRKAIKKFFSDGFQNIHFISHVSTPDQNSPHIMSTAGDKVWTSGQWNVTFQAQDGPPVQMKGYWLDVDVRQGNRWKILAAGRIVEKTLVELA